MEYVDGLSITEYSDRQRLGIRERLEIFLKVCAAVQHAHRNLILHRDIKPNNILVGNDGEPKLLDFGIAKLLDADPSRPSTRLTQRTNNIDVDAIAEARKLRVAELVRQIGGDLDTIVLKAMQKVPERRYATIREFAEDIRLYLHHRSVLARPDSLLYRTSKFVRRNTFAVAAAAAALVVAVTATALAFSRVSEERDLAEAERQKAEAISGFMQQIFEVSDPEESRGEAVSARDLLEEGAMLAAAAVLADLSKTTYIPAVEISALYQMGGEVDTAINWLEIAYDQHDPTLPYIGAGPFFWGTVPGYHDLLRRMNLAQWTEE